MDKRYEGVNPLQVYTRRGETPPQELVDLKEWEEMSPSPLIGESDHDMLRVRGRLFTTRDEVHYVWRSNLEITSLAHAFPFVDLCFTDAGMYTLGWHSYPRDSDHTKYLLEMFGSREDIYWVYQGGKSVESPILAASFNQPQDMTWREEREDVISLAEMMPRGLKEEQDDLIIEMVLCETDTLSEFCRDFEHILRTPSGRPYIVGNHAISGVGHYVGLDEQRLIEVPTQATVTSPQHPRDQVTLEEGIYLVFHPSKRLPQS